MNVGSVIGDKYEIKQEITRGGFGIIYQGQDRLLGKTVAIKAIDPDLLGEAKNIDMFQKEAISVAGLNHQNIVQIYDIKRNDTGQLFIIMEYVDGPNLTALLRACRQKQKTVPAYLAAHIIAEVCNGLDYAHNRVAGGADGKGYLVHQDISPVNIMLTHSGEIKIIDFGMANLKRQQETRGREVLIQGKIRYLAPEQANGAASVDRRIDIFASGLILFELLLGERLIRSNDNHEILETLVTGTWDLSRLHSDRISEKLQEVLRKALQHNPKNRYPTAKLMYKDLMHYLILTAPAADYAHELAQFMTELGPVELESDPESNENSAPQPIESAQPAAELLETTYRDSEAENAVVKEQSKHPLPEKETPMTPEPKTNLSHSVDSPPEVEQSKYYSFVEEIEEDDQRTIIDVVRLSARTHRKAVTLSFIGSILAFLIFTVVDTFSHFTAIGTGIYDFLFPPAIKIVSVPPGANIYLDDVLLDETTPLSINEIHPGVHKLVLTSPQFEPIVKSINVPRRGGIRVSGEDRRHASQPYILRFKSQFDITSNPTGADIYIDDVKLTQKTPATIFWDVSENPVDIRLEYAGLPSLTGLLLRPLENRESIEDHRIWNVKKIIPEKAHYTIEGIFHKTVAIVSNPAKADIYLDNNERPVGVTGLNGSLMLTLKTHLVTLKKKGYLSRSFSIDVHDSSSSTIRNNLLRTVRIFSEDAASSHKDDLGARIVELRSKHQVIRYKGTTPAIFNLLPYPYTATLSRKGYHDAVVEIQPTDKSVVVKMKPLLAPVTFLTVDAITNNPLDSASISYLSEGSTNNRVVLGSSSMTGEFTTELPPGKYVVWIAKEGYQKQRRNLHVRTDQDNRLTFRLTILR
ncbi:MAG: protein kinase [bacterium]